MKSFVFILVWQMPTKALSSTGLFVERPRSNSKGKLGQNQHSQPTYNMPNKPTENKTCHSQNSALTQGGGPGTRYHVQSFIHLPHGVHPTPQGSGCHTGVEAKAQRGSDQMASQRDLRLPCTQPSPCTCVPISLPHRKVQTVGKQPILPPFQHPSTGAQLDHTG